MCGIAGVLFIDPRQFVSEQTLEEIAHSISHRGPDSLGIRNFDGVSLVHLRLSIIDLAGGDQPMGNEDGTVQVVFNGEIYNYKELRQQLLSRGHHLRTNSDTEVLVHLYEDHGPDFITQLRGMFAFALWDSRTQRLMLARDRFGQKPLYYKLEDDRLLFASEIKGILAATGDQREVDLEALEDYLTYGVVPGHKSIFRGIRKLEPASWLVIGRNNWCVSHRRYWELREHVNSKIKTSEWVEIIRDKFKETVDAHRVSDVPIGAFLSGGLDSSAVVAALAESRSEPITTFSIGFHEKKYSELSYARLIAKRYGTNHIEEIVTPEAASSIEDLVKYYDEPFADPSAIPSMHVARLASQHVKVVLSGDGGDECFGGYSRYSHDLWESSIRKRIPRFFRKALLAPLARMWPKTDWLPRFLRAKTTLTNLSLECAEAYANTLSICRTPLRKSLIRENLRESLEGYTSETLIFRHFANQQHDPLRGMIAADIGMLLPDDFLTKVDRASMAFGLEVRPPMVDHEFLQMTQRIPSSLKVRHGKTKWIFKRACNGWLPDDIVHRPKQGFEIPVDEWLRKPLRDLFESTVLSPSAQIAAYIEQNEVRHLYEAHHRKTGRFGQVLWSLLVLGAWMEKYLPAPSIKGSTSLGATSVRL